MGTVRWVAAAVAGEVGVSQRRNRPTIGSVCNTDAVFAKAKVGKQRMWELEVDRLFEWWGDEFVVFQLMAQPIHD